MDDEPQAPALLQSNLTDATTDAEELRALMRGNRN
jgi:hypothetical protein